MQGRSLHLHRAATCDASSIFNHFHADQNLAAAKHLQAACVDHLATSVAAFHITNPRDHRRPLRIFKRFRPRQLSDLVESTVSLPSGSLAVDCSEDDEQTEQEPEQLLCCKQAKALAKLEADKRKRLREQQRVLRAEKARRDAECRQRWQVSESEKVHTSAYTTRPAAATTTPAAPSGSQRLRFGLLAPAALYHYTYASRPRLFSEKALRELAKKVEQNIRENIPNLSERDQRYHMGGKMTDTLSLPKLHSPKRSATPPANADAAAWITTPTHVRTDHGLPSNLRDAAEGSSADGEPALPTADITMTNTSLPFNNNDVDISTDMSQPLVPDQMPAMEDPITPFVDAPPTQSEVTADDNEGEEEVREHRAYAMLKFADSYAYINSLNLVITRDEEFYRRWQAEKKDEKKRAKLEGRANDALKGYRQEPSQPSQPGDEDRRDPSSRSGEGEALEGRPAPSLLSNYSESGGAVGFHSDDGRRFEDFSRPVRRNNGHSSSAASIDPADLQCVQPTDITHLTTHYTDEQGLEGNPRIWAALPVHPAVKEDIKKISREHMIFSYDTDREKWIMKVVGKSGVMLNGTHYPTGSDDVALSDGDEFWIATLQMTFLLPKHDDDEPEGVMDSVEEMSGSPVSRLLHEAESDEEDDTPLAQSREQPKKKSIKIKISSRKKAPEEEPAKGKGKGKGKAKNKAKDDKDDDADGVSQAKEAISADAPESDKKAKSAEKAEKGKKPKAAAPATAPAEENATATETSQEIKSEAPKATQASPPAVPVPTDPNSAIHGLSQDQMPEKRKGPGRPPKNGVLSKRDDAGVKRKMKEYERKGLPCPPLKEMLDEVRREQRAKDLAAKAAARGETVQDTPLPSIEPGGHRESDAAAHPLPQESNGLQSGSPSAQADRGSPRPRPRIRSPSPIKPESEFTEEELKKPTITYIYIIDEILQSIEGGQADLQTIYDKIQKRWPYFKYKVSSIGWQSSVRHNLLSCDRFKEAGKSGKGKFWTINHEVALDNKKKRPTPPPRPPPMPMANGQMPPGMPPNAYGQPGYPGQFPQGPYNANGQPGHGYYSSPYGAGQNGGYGPGPNMQNRQPSNGPYQRQGPPPPQRPPSQQPPQPKPVLPFQQIVNEMLGFRTTWLQGLTAGLPEYNDREASFLSAMNHYSALYHGGAAEETNEEKLRNEPFPSIKAIFDKYPAQNSQAQASAPPTGSENATAASATQQVVANGAQAPAATGPVQTQPVPQPAAPPGQPMSNGQAGQAQIAAVQSNTPASTASNVHPQPSAAAGQPQANFNAPPAPQQMPGPPTDGQPVQAQVTAAAPSHQVPAASQSMGGPSDTSQPQAPLPPTSQVSAPSGEPPHGSIPATATPSDQAAQSNGSGPPNVAATAPMVPPPPANLETEKKPSPDVVAMPAPPPTTEPSQQSQPPAAENGITPAPPQAEPAAAGTKRAAEDTATDGDDPEAKRQKTS